MGDQFEMLILNYCDVSHKLLNEMKQAVADSDAEALKRSAHPLKSSSAQLGAIGVSECAKKLEAIGLEGTVEGADELLDDFDNMLEESIAYLRSNV